MVRFKLRQLIVLILTCLVLYPTIFHLHRATILDDATLVRPSLFIAANLYNNENILDTWMKQVENVAQWVGPQRAFISIYENGSTDRTKAKLTTWEKHLEDVGIPHRIILDDAPKSTSRRVPMLANIRNKVLEPLYNSTEYEKILFLNDIVFDWKDAITLLNTRHGRFDAACGMDFFGEFYDTFATREVDGQPLGSGNWPYFVDEYSRILLKRGQPIPVRSCWNGIIALRATPFAKRQVAFRAIIPEEPNPPLEASECCLIHLDLHALHYDRVFIHPRVVVAYDRFHYWYARTILPLWRFYLNRFNHPTHEMPRIVEWTQRVQMAYDMQVSPNDYMCLSM